MAFLPLLFMSRRRMGMFGPLAYLGWRNRHRITGMFGGFRRSGRATTGQNRMSTDSSTGSSAIRTDYRDETWKKTG